MFWFFRRLCAKGKPYVEIAFGLVAVRRSTPQAPAFPPDWKRQAFAPRFKVSPTSTREASEAGGW